MEPSSPPPQHLPITAQWCVTADRCISLEVARTPEQQRLGMMQRPALPLAWNVVSLRPSKASAVLDAQHAGAAGHGVSAREPCDPHRGAGPGLPCSPLPQLWPDAAGRRCDRTRRGRGGTIGNLHGPDRSDWPDSVTKLYQLRVVFVPFRIRVGFIGASRVPSPST